jgi:hypothetical protein
MMTSAMKSSVVPRLPSQARSVRQLLCATTLKFSTAWLSRMSVRSPLCVEIATRNIDLATKDRAPEYSQLMHQFQTTAPFVKELHATIQKFCRYLPMSATPPVKKVRRCADSASQLSLRVSAWAVQACRTTCAIVRPLVFLSEPVLIPGPKPYEVRPAHVKSVSQGIVLALSRRLSMGGARFRLHTCGF